MNGPQLNFTTEMPFGISFWWWPLLFFGVWIVALVSLLRRQDLKDSDRIIWTIVICVTNVIGAVLYWFLAPSKPSTRSRAMTEAELKEFCNKGGRKE